jgi:hypothetical protein
MGYHYLGDLPLFFFLSSFFSFFCFFLHPFLEVAGELGDPYSRGGSWRVKGKGKKPEQTRPVTLYMDNPSRSRNGGGAKPAGGSGRHGGTRRKGRQNGGKKE